ncbi:hypothetical protein LCGC14_2196060 [marine sediment metagenome]|uniref:Peptidase S1 domain-containing protein n=1 Tax=marine sediment metagenome TaxID=412755 RepID=A0A0F9E598_9ZZZZ
MRKIILLIIAVAFFTTNAQGFPILDDYATYSTIEESSVSIFSVGEYFTVCSGVICGVNETKTFVLTAKHCIQPVEEMYANEKKVDVIITSSNDDLALLIIKGRINNKKETQIGKYLYAGDKVYTIGYPGLSLKPRKAKGEVIRFTDDWGYSTAEVINGCSGSGFFNRKGELVGIVWGGGVGDVSVFEPLKDVNEFLETINYETLIKNEL